MALDYAKWDDLYDSDEERQKDKRAEEAERKAALRKAQLNPKPAQIPGGMTEEQFAAQYAKMFKQPSVEPKQPYKFPETMEEQRAKCDEAEELKRRGNELFQRGELVEAAKLYEQAVLKFADWFAVAWSTDEEKEMVFAVKLPAHNNLANCSFKLGKHPHAPTHSLSLCTMYDGVP